jgi:methylenetetrahydrofolate reductase (NADPH)
MGVSPTAPGRLAEAIRQRSFAVTAEIGPPRGAATEPVRRAAALLRDWVDAVNITDNQTAHVRLSSLAGSIVALQTGVEPVMQLTCRDRNRIALQSELLSAGALGVPNVLLLAGDHPRHGDHADAAPVFDLDSAQLISAARQMRDDGRLMSGRELTPAPRWLIGAVDDPVGSPERLAGKVKAGAEFVQTQFVVDVPAFEDWMSQVRDAGLDEQVAILAGVGPIRSVRALEFLRTELPGVRVPDDVVRRLRGVPGDRMAAEGMALCVETVQRLREVPGVAGVHMMSVGFEQGVPEILERAGVMRTLPG